MASHIGSASLRHGFTYLSLLLPCLAGVALAQHAATDGQGPAFYQGLWMNPTGAVETVNCGTNSVFATSSTFAGCCSIGGNCNFPTACSKGKPTNRKGGPWTCGQDRECYTMTVFGSYPSPTDSWVVHNCAKSWTASTIYRSLPDSVMTTDGASSTTPTTTTTSPPDPGAGMITGAPDPNSGSTDGGDTSEESESPQSQAWIAGVVVGCLAAGAAVAGLGFWLGRRRKRGGPGGDSGEKPHSGQDPQSGFMLHPATMAMSGQHSEQQPDGQYSGYPPTEHSMQHSMPRAQTVVVAGGVEMEGGYGGYYRNYGEKGIPLSPQEAAGVMSVELAAEPVQQWKRIMK